MKVVIYRIARAHLKTGSIFSNHRILKQFKEIWNTIKILNIKILNWVISKEPHRFSNLGNKINISKLMRKMILETTRCNPKIKM